MYQYSITKYRPLITRFVIQYNHGEFYRLSEWASSSLEEFFDEYTEAYDVKYEFTLSRSEIFELIKIGSIRNDPGKNINPDDPTGNFGMHNKSRRRKAKKSNHKN
ncbi:MAG: hypothetical protein OCD76_09285 [Reichenbachiella sp.]